MSRLTEGQKRELLRIARDSVTVKLEGGRPRKSALDPDGLQESAGCFVTLHVGGRLRGCIGTFEASAPLSDNVAEMARSAAFGDPRFPKLTREELAGLDVEISVLSPMRRVYDTDAIEVGRHGLYVVRGVHRGVLLPQVATQYRWDRETFLTETCRKAGLPGDAWRHGAEVYTFEAEVFGEKD